eukprot:1387047-Pleurochrysis_carterae.AAC.2
MHGRVSKMSISGTPRPWCESRPTCGDASSHAEISCPAATESSGVQALYEYGQSPSVERGYVARPRFPSIQMAGQMPGRPGSPGKVYAASTIPPWKQNLLHDCTEPDAYWPARYPVLVVVISRAPSRVFTIWGVMYARLPFVGSYRLTAVHSGSPSVSEKRLQRSQVAICQYRTHPPS